MKNKFILLALLFIVTYVTYAQTADKKWSIGLFAGKNEYNGDLGNGIFKFNKASYNFGELSIGRYISKSFDFNLQGSYGDYGYYKSFDQNFLSRKSAGSFAIRYKFNNGYLLKEDAKLSPFVLLGMGIASYNGTRTTRIGNTTPENNEKGNEMIVPLGAGLKYKLSESLALQYKAVYNFTEKDTRDGLAEKQNDRFLEHTLGIVFSFGCKKDSDKDGVVDKLDKCPGTPAGVTVDVDGCPVDSDKDGVADYIDKCPTVFGLSAFNGCPDTDGDGIQDSEDKCPTVKGIAQFNGCPDTDGDGIQDSEDKCPTVKGIAQFNGCPDTDGDGIQDSEDKCPTIKGTAQFNGCPDTDGDGISDNLDKCPNEAGIKENNGCPAIKEEVKKVFEQALTGIQFESGKDIIKKASFPILDNVVKIMIGNPNYVIEINGHTDDQGDDAKNMTLSQNRAAAVKKYIENKGVDGNRMKPAGFGETIPVADNKTPAGRAKNRRVEFKVIF